jgi:hypothetical protein
MIDLNEIRRQLAQAREARIAAQLAGCEVEELTDSLRQTHPGWAKLQAGRRPLASLVEFPS